MDFIPIISSLKENYNSYHFHNLMPFTPTPENLAIRDEFLKGVSLIVNACAGSGKTTQMCWLTEQIENGSQKSILALSFSKAIVTELESRLPRYVIAKTYNGLGHNVWQQHVGRRLKVESNKMFTLLKDMLPWTDFELYGTTASKLVGIAKNAGVGTFLLPDEPRTWFDLMAKFNIFLDSEDADDDTLVKVCRSALAESNRAAMEGFCDFDDQLYMPILKGLKFPKYQIIFVDEAQDTNNIQREMVRQLLAPSGQLFVCGDVSQAIYGFRGADSDSMQKFQSEFNLKPLPLSVCFRCSQEVIKGAQRYVTSLIPGIVGIRAHDSAPKGALTHMPDYDVETFEARDAILCRNTAPLVTFAFGLIQRHVGCRVLGRESGTGLVTLIKSCKTEDMKELEQKLINRRTREVAKAVAKGADPSAIEDKYDCLNIFLQNNDSVEDVIAAITRLFDDKAKGLLTLSTIHKAKGLEWHRVFILDWGLLPSKWAKQPWMQQQERNLQYVASTRPKDTIVFIQSGQWRKPCNRAIQRAIDGVDNPVTTVNPPFVSVEPQPEPFPPENFDRMESDAAAREWYANQIYNSERVVGKGDGTE